MGIRTRHRVPAALGAAGLGLLLFLGITMMSSTQYTHRHVHIKRPKSSVRGPDQLQGVLPGERHQKAMLLLPASAVISMMYAGMPYTYRAPELKAVGAAASLIHSQCCVLSSLSRQVACVYVVPVYLCICWHANGRLSL
jgi:Na+/H+ antiporter NhaC